MEEISINSLPMEIDNQSKSIQFHFQLKAEINCFLLSNGQALREGVDSNFVIKRTRLDWNSTTSLFLCWSQSNKLQHWTWAIVSEVRRAYQMDSLGSCKGKRVLWATKNMISKLDSCCIIEKWDDCLQKTKVKLEPSSSSHLFKYQTPK